MAQSMTEFVLEQQDTLQKFELWWVAMNKKDPEAYPLSMADGNEGLWWEQFQDFDVSWLDNLCEVERNAVADHGYGVDNPNETDWGKPLLTRVNVL